MNGHGSQGHDQRGALVKGLICCWQTDFDVTIGTDAGDHAESPIDQVADQTHLFGIESAHFEEEIPLRHIGHEN